MARASKKLVPTETIEAAAAQEAAIAAQEAARKARAAAAQPAITAAVKTIYEAAGKVAKAKEGVEDAETEFLGKKEAAYLALADAAHANDLTEIQCTECLIAAMTQFYGNRAKDPIGTVATIRTELSRAMLPKVRGSIRTIIAPWTKAFDDEGKAIDTNKAKSEKDQVIIATPMRDKFHSKANAIVQAVKEAAGKPAKLNKKGVEIAGTAVPSFVAADTDTVLSWVTAHPRQSRAPQQATGKVTLPPVSDDKTPKDKAKARVDMLIEAVKEVEKFYPGLECFADVLTALRACTVAKLVPPAPVSPAPQPKPAKAVLAPEPVQGASDMVDDAMSDPVAALAPTNDMLAQFQAFQQFQAMMKANGK